MSEWTSRATCAREYSDADWFADRSDNKRSKAAITICRWCPVARECLDLALKAEHKSSDRQGIFGGLTPDDRELLWPSPATKPGPEGKPRKGERPTYWDRVPAGRNEAWLARWVAGETYAEIAATEPLGQSAIRKGIRKARDHAA